MQCYKGKPLIAVAKIRISERNTKKNKIFLLFPNESIFETQFQSFEKSREEQKDFNLFYSEME